jgi:hypothetical protein
MFYSDPQSQELLSRLDKPAAIQEYLDSIPYPNGVRNRSALNVVREATAHCLDGGLFAAAALKRLGYPARIIDLQPDSGMDDDHVLAIYQVDGAYGCLAKSNYPGLRSRQPVYSSLRELAMSYFEPFFNIDRVRTLRYYTPLVDLERRYSLAWTWEDAAVDRIEKDIKKLRRYPLLKAGMAQRLDAVDAVTFKAFTLGLNWEGVFKPEHTDTVTDARKEAG